MAGGPCKVQLKVAGQAICWCCQQQAPCSNIVIAFCYVIFGVVIWCCWVLLCLSRCLGRTFGGQGCCPIPWPCPFGHDALVPLSLILPAILALKTMAMGTMSSSADGLAKPHH